MYPVPDSFPRQMVELYGAAGAAWLERLPAIGAACERRWSVSAGAPFGELSYSYVAPAVRADGRKVVLKLSFPCHELHCEIEALRLYDGRGSAQLLAADPDQGTLLLERLEPGMPLSGLNDDEEATAVAAGVMQALWRPVPPGHAFLTVAEWAGGLGRLRATFGGGSGPFPRELVEQAEALFAELLGSMAEPVLLHGDLHHFNILAAERQPWLAIDPKGVVGEPAYEVGALLRNRILDQPQPARIMARRIAQLAELLGIDRARLRAWGLAQAVLSAWWAYEDHGAGWEGAIACAELMAGETRGRAPFRRGERGHGSKRSA